MDIVDQITNLNDIATLPTVANRILRVLESEETNVTEVAGLIEHDPSLTLKLLKAVNSPVYATQSKILSINEAIMIIGYRKLANLVLGVSVFSMFWMTRKNGSSDIINKFWLHSASTAALAKSIISKMNRDYNENEFVGGLLHQIGKMAMIQFDLNRYQRVIELITNEGLPHYLAEKEVFGTDHLVVGERLALKWQLPNIYQEIILNYADPTKVANNQELVASISFANILSELHGADFYFGEVPLDLPNTPSWKVLSSASDELNIIGTKTIENEADSQLQASLEFIRSIKK